LGAKSVFETRKSAKFRQPLCRRASTAASTAASNAKQKKHHQEWTAMWPQTPLRTPCVQQRTQAAVHIFFI